MRFTLLGIALCLLCITAFLLHRPLKPDEVPAWNPLVMGYTVIMLAAALLFFAAGGALILVSLSKKRATMRRRLFRLITFTVTSLLCVVILDVVVSLFPALQSVYMPLSLREPPGRVYDKELGFKFEPNLKAEFQFDVNCCDLVIAGQVANPLPTGEPEMGMTMTVYTDADGFFNETVPDRCDIVAVGDSYVGQTPVPHDRGWLQLVGRDTGMKVYNLGVGHFTVQQELIALKRSGLPKKPRVVLWGYFQANDLYEAEQFDDYQKSGTDWRTFRMRQLNFERPFPYNRPVARILLALFRHLSLDAEVPKPPYPGPHKISAGGVEKPMAFNRYYFHAPALSRPEIEDSREWEIICSCLRQAKKVCKKSDAKFVVLYFPAKLSAYAPYVMDKFDRKKIHEFALAGLRDLSHIDADELIERIRKNRLVQYQMLKEFCDSEGIALLDTMPAIRGSIEKGQWPYFCYDTHMNIVGNRVVAEVVSAYLNSTSPSEPTPGGAP